MKYRPVYKNLDTSFVDLAALLDYLRGHRFDGLVRFEMNDCAADIYLTAGKELRVRGDKESLAGQATDQKDALRRVLSRSREPGGVIHVFQCAAESENLAGSSEVTEIRETPKQTEPPHAAREISQLAPPAVTNGVEEPARRSGLSTEGRETLLELTGELLGTIDRTLAGAGLGFRAAFRKACGEIDADYPFLKTLDYDQGKIVFVDAPPRPEIFVAGVLEALRRILGKLGANPRFAEIHRATVQKIIALLHRRRASYDKFCITAPLEKILGT